MLRYDDMAPKMYAATETVEARSCLARISFEEYEKRVDEKTHGTTDAERYELAKQRRLMASRRGIGDWPKDRKTRFTVLERRRGT